MRLRAVLCVGSAECGRRGARLLKRAYVGVAARGAVLITGRPLILALCVTSAKETSASRVPGYASASVGGSSARAGGAALRGLGSASPGVRQMAGACQSLGGGGPRRGPVSLPV